MDFVCFFLLTIIGCYNTRAATLAITRIALLYRIAPTMSSDEESIPEPPRLSYEELVEHIRVGVVHAANSSTGPLWDLDDTVCIGNPEDWNNGTMTGDTICMVLNDMAVPSDYVHEHPELLNLANVPVQCLICDQSPCWRHSDEGMVIIFDGHATVGENREFGDLTHQERKAIRYTCYGRFHTLIFGILERSARGMNCLTVWWMESASHSLSRRVENMSVFVLLLESRTMTNRKYNYNL
jgi:hypothetical protein